MPPLRERLTDPSSSSAGPQEGGSGRAEGALALALARARPLAACDEPLTASPHCAFQAGDRSTLTPAQKKEADAKAMKEKMERKAAEAAAAAAGGGDAGGGGGGGGKKGK
jgi:hypothetical protein